MKKYSTNFNLDHQNMMFLLANMELDLKGYMVEKVYFFGDSLKKDYRSCPFEMIIFEDFATFPSVPNGFKLTHNMVAKNTSLTYSYKIGLKKEKLLKRRSKVAVTLLAWAMNLPDSFDV